jgi:hypothetical protein
VAPATQNLAMHALVCHGQRVLTHALLSRINAVGADQKINGPMAMTCEDVAAVFSLMNGTANCAPGSFYVPSFLAGSPLVVQASRPAAL